MVYDVLFIGSNIFFLFFPFGLGFLYKYSLYLQKHILNPTEDDHIFQKNNSKFHFLFKLLTISGLIVSFIYLTSIILINNKIFHLHHLTKIDFSQFIFILIQTYFVLLFAFSIIFAFLYFRFRPDYRHSFIQKLSFRLSLLVIAGCIINITMYISLSRNLILPTLLTFTPQKSTFLFNTYNFLPSLILIVLFVLYSYVYTKFGRKRTIATSRVYLGSYIMVILGIILVSFNASTKYFDLLGPGLTKQSIFYYSTFYSGIFWIYLSILSFLSIIFSIFIYRKKDKFIGSQFAISYTLKLSSINFYSTMGLFLITLLPWILLQYYNYF